MKEYKVVKYFRGLTLNYDKYLKDLEDFLNNYARQGWRVKETGQGMTVFILERDKN